MILKQVGSLNSLTASKNSCNWDREVGNLNYFIQIDDLISVSPLLNTVEFQSLHNSFYASWQCVF